MYGLLWLVVEVVEKTKPFHRNFAARCACSPLILFACVICHAATLTAQRANNMAATPPFRAGLPSRPRARPAISISAYASARADAANEQMQQGVHPNTEIRKTAITMLTMPIRIAATRMR